jgi:thiol-disulfide isomerase/thioredoxin
MPIGIHAEKLKELHQKAQTYEAYLGDQDHAIPWRDNDARTTITPEQQAILHGFVRKMNVLVLSGVWCGDCSAQGPMLAAIANESDCIDLRWLDRDANQELAEHLSINAGHRVPTVLFMAEDYEPVSVLGDRTLTRYRAVAARELGAVCDIPGATIPENEYNDTVQEWLNEFERVQLLLRLSPRLSQKHGD